MLVIVLFNQSAIAKDFCACHPSIDSQSRQFITAYGSLMESNSKKATDNRSGENKPVWVEHYQRGWFSKGLSDGFSTTYLGVIKSKHAHFNGTILTYPLPIHSKIMTREKNITVASWLRHAIFIY